MAEVKEPKEEVKAPKAAATKTVFLQRASETEQQFEFVCINGKAESPWRCRWRWPRCWSTRRCRRQSFSSA